MAGQTSSAETQCEPGLQLLHVLCERMARETRVPSRNERLTYQPPSVGHAKKIEETCACSHSWRSLQCFKSSTMQLQLSPPLPRVFKRLSLQLSSNSFSAAFSGVAPFCNSFL